MSNDFSRGFLFYASQCIILECNGKMILNCTKC